MARYWKDRRGAFCWVVYASASAGAADTFFPQYNLEITNTTGAPDGVERLMMLVNGQFPGPTIEAGKLASQLKDRGIRRSLTWWFEQLQTGEILSEFM